jgi:plastocyanin
MKRVLIAVAISGLTAACGAPTAQYGAVGAAGPSGAAPTATAAVAGTPAPQLVRAITFAFEPQTLTIPVGTTVTFRNDDGEAHTFTADGGAFDSGQVAGGRSFSFTFSTPGTFAYHCNIHSSMRGTISVTSSGTGANQTQLPTSVGAAPSASPDPSGAADDHGRHHHDG